MCFSGRKRGKTLLGSEESKIVWKHVSNISFKITNCGYWCVKMPLNMSLRILAGVKTCFSYVFWWEPSATGLKHVPKCLQEQLLSRLFKFSEKVTLKTLHHTFSQSCERQTLRPLVPFQQSASFVCNTAKRPAEGPNLTSWHWGRWSQCHFISREYYYYQYIHFKAGTNTKVLTGVWTDFFKLDVCGANTVVIQAEGEAAAGVRLRLRAVPPTPAGHVSWCCEDPQPAAWSCWRHAGARVRGGEGVGGGRGGGGGGRRGEGRQGGHGAKGTVVIFCIHDGGLTRRDRHPGLPARGHRAGLDQLGSALVAETSRRWGGIVTSIERGCTFEWETLRRTSEVLDLHLNVPDPAVHLFWRVCLNVESSGTGNDLEQVVS